MKILPLNGKKDKWDEILEKTINDHKCQQQEDFENLHGHHEHIDKFSDKFEFFDSTPSPEEKSTVVLRRSPHDDSLKQIYEKEFGHTNDESKKFIQKPPRRSLEMRKSWDRQSNLSTKSYNF